MNKEQQRIAIAEWMGWTLISVVSSHEPMGYADILTGELRIIPNYPEDLDAMHEAEEKLLPHKRGFYNAELSKLVSNRNLSSAVKEPEFIFMLLNAAASQRSEALCRTLFRERFQ